MSDAATLPTRETDPQVAGARVARLYERHGRTLYGLCMMLLRDPHDAEDALQSTFLSAHRALVRGGAPRDEVAWLVTIARNECRGRIRTRMETPVHGDVGEIERLLDPGPPPDELLADEGVRKALGSLPESQREAVVLHDVLGLRSREVGRALGMSVPAVEALLFRARRQLRVRLRPTGALVLPAAVGYSLAQAIPGFVAPAAAGIAGATGGAAGAGILAKLAGAPAAAKVAAGVAAAATAGSVAVVEVTHEPRGTSRPVPAQVGHGAGTAPVQGTAPGPAPTAVAAQEKSLPASTVAGPSSSDRRGGSDTRREVDEHAEEDRSAVEPTQVGSAGSNHEQDGGDDRAQGVPTKADDSDDDGASGHSGSDDRVVTGDDDGGASARGSGSAEEPRDGGESGSGDGASGGDGKADDDPETPGSDGAEQDDGEGTGAGGSGHSGSDDDPAEPDTADD